MAQELYFEDFHPGKVFQSIYSYKVTAEEIKEFGEKYDPQPFHIDEAAGENSFFKGLAASGWLTAAIVMRLRVQSMPVAGGMIGAGVEDIRWTQAVRPGDTLRTEAEIQHVRRSSTAAELWCGEVADDGVQPAQRGSDAVHGELPGAAAGGGAGLTGVA